MKLKIVIGVCLPLLTGTVSAAPAPCKPQAGEIPLRVKVGTVGAINKETLKELSSLMRYQPIDVVKDREPVALQRLFANHLVEYVEGGELVCAEKAMQDSDYATRIRLRRIDLSIWVRNMDLSKID